MKFRFIILASLLVWAAVGLVLSIIYGRPGLAIGCAAAFAVLILAASRAYDEIQEETRWKRAYDPEPRL